MSVLGDEQTITATRLEELGFWRSGWGSPSTRREKNTNMYETLDDTDYREWHIMWFPKKFSGTVYAGTSWPVNVRGRCLITPQKGPRANSYYLSPKLTTMEELDVFISQVIMNKWPTLREEMAGKRITVL